MRMYPESNANVVQLGDCYHERYGCRVSITSVVLIGLNTSQYDFIQADY
jgi:hypothetical protein